LIHTVGSSLVKFLRLVARTAAVRSCRRQSKSLSYIELPPITLPAVRADRQTRTNRHWWQYFAPLPVVLL